LKLPLTSAAPTADARAVGQNRAAEAADRLVLAVTPERLELRSLGRGRPGPIYVDFVGGAWGYERRQNPTGPLYQAVDPRGTRPSVIDATAGLGRDAFRLARYGATVIAVERHAVLVALLEDGLARARQIPELDKLLGARLRLIQSDARQFLAQLPAAEAPEVIYLDPMFPPRRKAALGKKELRVLRQLVGDDPDAGELLAVARRVAGAGVVVKRMRLSAELAPGVARSYAEQSTRYDVYEPLAW
jgi:16S rRNA (guanine1516-N2)-methyltransferase